MLCLIVFLILLFSQFAHEFLSLSLIFSFNECVLVLFLFLTSTLGLFQTFFPSSTLSHHPHFFSPDSWTHLLRSSLPPFLPFFSSDNESDSSIEELSINLCFSRSPPSFLLSLSVFALPPLATDAFLFSSSFLHSLQDVTHPHISHIVFSHRASVLTSGGGFISTCAGRGNSWYCAEDPDDSSCSHVNRSHPVAKKITTFTEG